MKTDYEKRIEIGQFAGTVPIDWKQTDIPAKDGTMLWRRGDKAQTWHQGHAAMNAPDYLNSLDAMHEAIKRLSVSQWRTFIGHVTGAGMDVERLFTRDDLIQLMQIDCREIADAFLKTIGRYE